MGEYDERQQLINGLRGMADTLENNPGIGMPEGSLWYRVHSKDDMAKLARAFPGQFNKAAEGHTFTLRQYWGTLSFDIDAAREDVCERKVLGTKTVTRSRPVGEVEYEDVEIVEDVVEWTCPQSIMAATT